MIVKLLRQCGECLGNRWSLRFPSWQFSALQNMHLLICRAEDKYLLMLPGFILICLNSSLYHHLKWTARALLKQPKVLSLSACSAWRLEAEHSNLSVSQSHVVNATHLARMKGEDAPGGSRGGGAHDLMTVQGHQGEELNMTVLHRATPPATWVWTTQELLFQHHPTASNMSW